MATHDATQHPSTGTTMGGSMSAGQGKANQGMPPVQDAAAQAVDKIQETAAQVKDTVREGATARLADQKDQVADNLGTVAHAVRRAGEHLRGQDQGAIAAYTDQAAERIDQFTEYLSQRSVTELLDDVQSFARREPALFLGGAFALGLLGARFFRSSAPSSGSGGGQYRAYGQGAGGMSQSTYRAGGTYGSGSAYGVGMGRGMTPGMGTPSRTPAYTPTPAYSSPTTPRPASGMASPGASTPMGTTGASSFGAGAARSQTTPGTAGDVIVGGPPITDAIVGGPPIERRLGTDPARDRTTE